MPPRLDDHKRAAILAQVEAGQLSRNAIAASIGWPRCCVGDVRRRFLRLIQERENEVAAEAETVQMDQGHARGLDKVPTS